MSRKVKLLLVASAISSLLIIFLSLPVHLPFVGPSEANAAQPAAPEPATLAVLGLAGGFGLVRRFLKRRPKTNHGGVEK